MGDIVYAVRISNLEYTGLKIMDVKIGKSTNIENTLSQYRRGNRNIELLDIWTPNPEKNLSTAERGVQEIAERYAYDKQSEKFVFLQRSYQDFAETVNKVLYNASREEIEEDQEQEQKERKGYTGTTPAVVKFKDETFEVNQWLECMQKVAGEILNSTDEKDKIMQVRGSKRDYFVREENQSYLVYPKNIPDTDFYFEGKLSANDVARIIKNVMEKYGYEPSELEIYTEEEQSK